MNNVTLIGRLTSDPELMFIPTTGQAVSKFTLAVDKGYSKDKKEECQNKNKPTADFIRIVVYGKTAENCANYLKKGKKTAVEGSISTSMYVANDGSNRYVTEVLGRKIEFIEWSSKPKTQADSGYEDGFGFEPVDDDDIPF